MLLPQKTKGRKPEAIHLRQIKTLLVKAEEIGGPIFFLIFKKNFFAIEKYYYHNEELIKYKCFQINLLRSDDFRWLKKEEIVQFIYDKTEEAITKKVEDKIKQQKEKEKLSREVYLNSMEDSDDNT